MTESQAPAARIELLIERQVATIALNRPAVRNAIDDDLRRALMAAFEQIAADNSIRAVVVTGRGTAFCAGGDIAGMRQRLEAPAGEIALNGWRRQQQIHHFVAALHDLPKP